jgi:hypothetical protein
MLDRLSFRLSERLRTPVIGSGRGRVGLTLRKLLLVLPPVKMVALQAASLDRTDIVATGRVGGRVGPIVGDPGP